MVLAKLYLSGYTRNVDDRSTPSSGRCFSGLACGFEQPKECRRDKEHRRDVDAEEVGPAY